MPSIASLPALPPGHFLAGIAEDLDGASSFLPQGKGGESFLSGINGYTILAGVIFGLIGWGAFRYGKAMDLWKPKLIGVAMMVYPYMVYNRYAVWIVGVALIVLLWFQHDE